MARMPRTRWVGEQSPRDPMLKYDIMCVHTIVGYAPAHAAHFSVHAEGTIDQSRDTAFQSGANLYGNHRIIAVENEDHGPAFGGTPKDFNAVPFTKEQVISNGRILHWCHEEHGIPLKLCPNSLARSRGLAYHRQGIDGNFDGYRFPGRVSRGEIWTKHFGKICPGDARIAQLPDILDVAVTLFRGGSIPTEEDMQLNDDIYPDPSKKKTVAQLFRQLDNFMQASARREQRLLGILGNQLPALRQQIDAIPDSPTLGQIKAELKRQLESLEVQFKVVVQEDTTTTQ